MKNLEIAQIFYDMGDILELKDVEWKPQAYRKAARALESLSEDVEVLYRKGGLKALESIPGIGEKLAKKIVEYIETGKVKEYERLKRSIPEGLSKLLDVPGLGPKKALVLYKKLKIKNLKDLEEAVKKHQVSKLPTFKQKTEENILRGIQIYKTGQKRKLLSIALPIAEEIINYLKKLKEVETVQYAGSLRRMKETIGDIDILLISDNPAHVMEKFTNMQLVKQVIAKGKTKSTVLLKNNLQVDLRVLTKNRFGAGMQYFTGNKDHNIELRKIAIEEGYKLSEYGLFNKKGRIVAGKTEKEVYNKLGLKYIEPELRENRGEIEAALKNKLPKLINYNDIKGDFHVHSRWSDGAESAEEIAKAAVNFGYEYVCITDHSKSQHIAHGLTEEDALKKIKAVKRVDSKLNNIRVLAGTEVDILSDGSLDYDDKLLKKFDIVVAAVHSRFKMSRESMTNRIIKAMENKNVHIIAHPTGRILGQREPYELDIDILFEKAKETNTFLEINAAPERLDLNDVYVKAAIDSGLRLALGTDAHSISQLQNIRYGVAMARRGWCTKKHVINTLSFKQIKKVFKLR